jgi:hypothetical protein
VTAAGRRVLVNQEIAEGRVVRSAGVACAATGAQQHNNIISIRIKAFEETVCRKFVGNIITTYPQKQITKLSKRHHQ